jgi:predicted nucleic acid-binding protein
MKLVDSSAWVEFFRRRGDPAVKQRVAGLLQSGQAAYTCPILFELLSGVRSEEETHLEEALSFCEHIPFNVADWRAAALLERRLRGSGLNLPRNDLYVAVVALRRKLPVLCRDKHFSAAAKLLGESLRVEQV